MNTINYKYERIPAENVTVELLDECSALFSNHYGVWSTDYPDITKRGKKISLNGKRLRDYLSSTDSWVATARNSDGMLIGYCFVIWLKYKTNTISWVTQLVVHKEYRQKLVASVLLNSAWGYSNHLAWGIASANPFAIKALEKATRRPVSSKKMQNHQGAVDAAISQIGYLKGKKVTINDKTAIIDSQFPQDISSVKKHLAKFKKEGSMWTLGNLPEGHEWLGVTFRIQKQKNWTENEWLAFRKGASQVAAKAYERMAEANPEKTHSWAKPEYAQREIDYLEKEMEMQPGDSCLDLGCGAGRHSIALSRKMINVTGIDSSNSAISYAKKKSSTLEPKVELESIAKHIWRQIIELTPQSMKRIAYPALYQFLKKLIYNFTIDKKNNTLKPIPSNIWDKVRRHITTTKDGEQVADFFGMKLPVVKANAPQFYCADILSWDNHDLFDHGICLYDVIGSYPDDQQNEMLLSQFVKRIRPGGKIAFSVLSYDYMAQRAKHICDGTPQAHFGKLVGSNTMESSGEIFNPDLVLVDKSAKVCYRKEQFQTHADLPLELIVADRRYTVEDVKRMCEKNSIIPQKIGFVRAGKFELIDTDPTNVRKELLVIGTKNGQLSLKHH